MGCAHKESFLIAPQGYMNQRKSSSLCRACARQIAPGMGRFHRAFRITEKLRKRKKTKTPARMRKSAHMVTRG